MKCPDCESDLQDSAEFCYQCGMALRPAKASFAAPARDRIRTPSMMTDENEELLWTGSFAAKGMIHSWLLAILITLVLPMGGVWVHAGRLEWLVIVSVVALVWLGLGAVLVFYKLNVHYELTDQRLIHRSGIFRRLTDRIELIDMDDVSHEQGLIERLFDVGTIEIKSSDRTHPTIYLPGIKNVDGVAALIDDARRRERMRRGIHIEQI